MLESAIFGTLIDQARGARPLHPFLLNRVRQLVREQVLAAARVRLVLALCEYDMGAHRIGVGIDIAGGTGCFRIIVHAHMAEVAIEAILHELATVGIEPSAWRGKCAVHGGRDSACGHSIGCTSLQRCVLGRAALALAADSTVGTAGALSLQDQVARRGVTVCRRIGTRGGMVVGAGLLAHDPPPVCRVKA